MRSAPGSEQTAVADFLTGEATQEEYGRLATMFLQQYLRYCHQGLSLASYPGEDSNYGKHQDDIEGFSRIILLLAAQLVAGVGVIAGPGGVERRVEELLVTGISNAVTPGSGGYYGDIGNKDGRIIAAALFSLALWLTREITWSRLPEAQKNSIGRWLASVNHKEVSDNNWHLFVVIVNAVLKSLALPYDQGEYLGHYARHKSFYQGDGFYRDGPEGNNTDLYNAWEVHPFLILLDQIDPALDREFIRETTSEFLTNFSHFFSPSGFPIFGRSICYRLALPTAFVLADLYGWSPLPAALTKSIHDSVWRHFLQRGAVRNGLITQGYYGTNLHFLDAYSGPASANWGLFSLAAALLHAAGSRFWRSEPELLPVQRGDFRLVLAKANLEVLGVRATGNVALRKIGVQMAQPAPQPTRYARWQWLLNRCLLRTGVKASRIWGLLPFRIRNLVVRPSNTFHKYQLNEYRSERPFCEP